MTDTFETTWTLQPIHHTTLLSGKTYHEQILFRDADSNNYPFALVHVDSFYRKNQEGLYELLRDGKTLKVKVTMEIINEDD